MQRTCVDGITTWWRWQPDRGVNFNSWLVEGAAGAFVVDPLEPDDPATLYARCRAAGVKTIVITNRDHERAAAAFKRELGARVIAPAADAAQLTSPPDATVTDGDLVLGWRVVGLSGFKTPGEMVLYAPERRTAICGDAFWGDPAGSLRLMPDDKLADPAQAILSTRFVRALWIDHLLVGDGQPIYGAARAALDALIARRAADAPVDVLNLDEVRWRSFAGDPAPFNGEAAEIGLVLGAERLGIAAGRIAPGQSYCPLHWHTREEEFFIVWSGRPTLRTPDGTRRLRPGDCAVFVTSPRGAHRLSNETDEPCVIVMVASVDAGDVCFYPDSNKLLVERTGTLVKAEPELDYFAGETAANANG